MAVYMEASGCHLHALLRHTKSPVISWKGACACIWYSSFVAAPQKTSLDNLALVDSGSCVHMFSGMVANKQTKKAVLKWYPPRA